MTTATLQLARQLIARPSVTPDDAGCMALLRQRLEPLGFVCEAMPSGPDDFRVQNLWAKRGLRHVKTGVLAINRIANDTPANPAPANPANPAVQTASAHGGADARAPAHTFAQTLAPPSPLDETNAETNANAPTLVFAGHTDVVPPGPAAQWCSPPFEPTVRDGKLYGRGASDMKTSIAAFVVAVEEFLAARPDAPLNIALLLTSDEEGPAVDGTVKVCEALRQRGQRLDYCIVGEPTAAQRTGDTIKNGRRGSLSGRLTVKGVQGHIAYPHLAQNPIHSVAPALAALAATAWDAGNEFFPPTSWQISNLHSGTGASNVIPGTAVIDFNFRFSTESTPEGLQQRLEAILQQHGLHPAPLDGPQTGYHLQWTLVGLPFLTRPGTLVAAVQAAITAETGLHTELSTSGGTSDGRFIAAICPQVVEIGPPNASIHKIDEHIALADVEPLKNIYRRVLENLANAPRP